MSAGIYYILIEQFATFNLPITWQDANGNAIDVTGYTANLDIKDTAGTIITTLTTSNGGITLGGVLGTITLIQTATQTAALPPGIYNYDLVLTSGATRTRLIEGTAQIQQGLTP